VSAAPADGEVHVYTLTTGVRDVTRALTKRVLAEALGISSDVIAYDVGPKGKPMLRNDPTLHFSVAHSRDVSMIAVTRVAPVGVDVERVRVVPQAEAILRRFFPERDVSEILDSEHRDVRFVSAWTRAEATVKVRGASVWDAATPDPTVIVRALTAPDGYVASVAVAAPEWTIRQLMIDDV